MVLISEAESSLILAKNKEGHLTVRECDNMQQTLCQNEWMPACWTRCSVWVLPKSEKPSANLQTVGHLSSTRQTTGQLKSLWCKRKTCATRHCQRWFSGIGDSMKLKQTPRHHIQGLEIVISKNQLGHSDVPSIPPSILFSSKKKILWHKLCEESLKKGLHQYEITARGEVDSLENYLLGKHSVLYLTYHRLACSHSSSSGSSKVAKARPSKSLGKALWAGANNLKDIAGFEIVYGEPQNIHTSCTVQVMFQRKTAKQYIIIYVCLTIYPLHYFPAMSVSFHHSLSFVLLLDIHSIESQQN